MKRKEREGRERMTMRGGTDRKRKRGRGLKVKRKEREGMERMIMRGGTDRKRKRGRN